MRISHFGSTYYFYTMRVSFWNPNSYTMTVCRMCENVNIFTCMFYSHQKAMCRAIAITYISIAPCVQSEVCAVRGHWTTIAWLCYGWICCHDKVVVPMFLSENFYVLGDDLNRNLLFICSYLNFERILFGRQQCVEYGMRCLQCKRKK